MPLNFFDDESQNSGNGTTAFLNDWITENPKNKTTIFLVNEIKRVQSGKGYMALTDYFAVFLWKNSKLTKMLVEALEYYVAHPDKGFAICVVLKKANKPDYQLALDTDIPTTWFTSKNGFTTSEQDVVSQELNPDGNPFLVM